MYSYEAYFPAYLAAAAESGYLWETYDRRLQEFGRWCDGRRGASGSRGWLRLRARSAVDGCSGGGEGRRHRSQHGFCRDIQANEDPGRGLNWTDVGCRYSAYKSARDGREREVRSDLSHFIFAVVSKA